MFAVDCRGHDDRIRVALDSLINDRRSHGARLQELGHDVRCASWQCSLSRALGAPQGTLARVDVRRQLGIKGHRLRNLDHEQKGHRGAVSAQEVWENVQDTIVNCRTGNRHN
jgi:hypothetical protein